MKLDRAVAGLLVVGSLSSLSAFAADSKMNAADWEKSSLKGIKSIKYGIGYDPTKAFTKTMAATLADTKLPMKSVNLDVEQPLESGEALVKTYIDDRKGGQAWVGLSVDQKSQLERNPSITYSAETYAVGKLVAKKDAGAAIKEMCVQFVKDFNAAK
ncbi:MAG: hypothetical protein K2Y22_08905 [Candidatus Obscuribacterales bacterium]|nr:hypothetical protein [Candidatus Obscuribacterales bacterium]